MRTTGQIHVGASGGVWAELDVTAGEKKGGKRPESVFFGGKQGGRALMPTLSMFDFSLVEGD